MTKQLGRAMLVKIDASDGLSFLPLCGLNSKTFSINNSSIDVTTPDCTTPSGVMWSEVLDGVKSVSVSGDGIFVDEAAELQLEDVVMNSPPVDEFQVVIPDFGTFEGVFFVESLEFGGDSTGGATFSLSLVSSGEITFTAV
jgi:TP901-1 family phage major tail protein